MKDMDTSTRILLWLIVIIGGYFILRIFLASLFWFFGSLFGLVAIVFLVWMVLNKKS